MTEQQRKLTAMNLYNDLNSLMRNLYARWLDEQEYEDITEYGKRIAQDVTAAGGTFGKMQKRPFGFTCQIADATYAYTINARRYSYKRIA